MHSSKTKRTTDDLPFVLTVGHSTHTVEEFIRLLQVHAVTRVVDVRTVPRSRHNPQFNRDSLPRSLKKAGPGYVHMAGLGGLRHAARVSLNMGWRNASFRGFADYMRPPLRLAAIVEQQVICAFTHDSIGLGENGTTHQPVEQLANLRAIPRLVVIRPCDGNETAYAWLVAIETQDRPVALVLTRQDVPPLDRSRGDAWRRDWPRPLSGASAPGPALMREYDR